METQPVTQVEWDLSPAVDVPWDTVQGHTPSRQSEAHLRTALQRQRSLLPRRDSAVGQQQVLCVCARILSVQVTTNR